MKKPGLLGIFLFCLVFLVSCASNMQNPFSQSQINHDYLTENWIRRVDVDPGVWTRNADRWFLTGEQNRIERKDQNAPASDAISTMNVRVFDFTQIQVNAAVEIQIVGQQEHNSVNVLGPNDQVRQLSIGVYNNTLFIRQAKDSKGQLSRVIVRIGVRDLRQLTNRGGAYIEGRDVTSNNLCIDSGNGGNILLAGDMNVSKITQTNGGSITVIGAYTPSLTILVKGNSNGNVNVSGRVGVRSITNLGRCKVNIIGADTDALNIYAANAGIVSIAGYANVKKINASGNSQVYLYWVNSNGTYVVESDNARVGLAGMTRNINIDISGSSQFQGQFLHGSNVYVRTRNYSHANVTADQKLFAAAYDHSSIYFFGSPNIVSRFSSDYGVVIPVWNEGTTLPYSTLPPPPSPSMQSGVVATPYKSVVPASYQGEVISPHHKKRRHSIQGTWG